MSAYGALAAWYDALTRDVDYAAFADFYEQCFQQGRGACHTLLDFCCGTGTLTRLMAARGYEMIATDGSPDMLMQAQAHNADLPADAVQPLLLCQEASQLDLYGTVDAAYCSLDGIDYLPPEELPEVLHRLHLFVRPGGMLILDIRDPASFRALDGGTFVDETDDVLCLWRAEFDAAAQTMHYGMDLFTRAGELWSRASEEHIEYAHTPERLAQLLTQAGFLDVTVRRDGPQADAGRIFLTAMRSLESASELCKNSGCGSMRAAPDSKISEVKTMDEIIRAVSKDGFVKISVVTARDAVQRANAIHHCSPTAIAALGRSLCAASMLGDLLKEENGALTLRISGGGGLGSIIAVSDSEGNVRGMVSNPAFDLPTRPDGKLDVGGAVGKDGMLTVSRDIGLREPYVGSTELVSGEIAEDLSAYLVESEQIPAACGLGVLVDTDHSVKAAGGFLVQLMPGAPEDLITKLEDNIFMMDQLTTILDEDGADAILSQVMRGLEPETVLRHPMAYRCACSRARVEQALRQCGVQELQDMIADGKNTQVHCQFCDAEYVFTPAELQTLLDAENADAAAD